MDELIDILDLEYDYSTVHTLHKTVVSAQDLLFSSAAVRYAGSFTTNTSKFEDLIFEFKNFSIQILKVKKT